jgi:hypothetical protein
MKDQEKISADISIPEASPTVSMVEVVFPHTIKLIRPFDYGQERVESVTLEKEPDAGDLVQIMNVERKGDQMLRIVSTCTGWPDPKIKLIKARDILAIVEVVKPFLGGGQEIGH